jgi:hypothetical protein
METAQQERIKQRVCPWCKKGKVLCLEIETGMNVKWEYQATCKCGVYPRSNRFVKRAVQRLEPKLSFC